MRYTVGDTIELYERNYDLLERLIPTLASLRGSVEFRVGAGHMLRVQVVEQCAYSAAVEITYQLHSHTDWVGNVHLAVRLYHDARVAEVTGYQRHTYRRPWYSGNPDTGASVGEKRQINLFLNECLNHCRREGCAAIAQNDLTLT